MVCLRLIMITTLDYYCAAPCHALAGFVIRIMFWTNTVPPTDKAGVYDWSITSIIRSR